MTTRPPCRRPVESRRAGFTIIELLMVILIIGVLAALLFPAISKAIENARTAEVVTEMKSFEAGIKQFRSRFGIDPPSFIVLYEQGAAIGAPGPNWGVHGSAGSQTDSWRTNSRTLIRQMWPEFDFDTLGDSPALPLPVGPGNPVAGNGAIDINGNGTENDVLILNGAECLVFFLFGVPRQTDFDGDGTIDGWSVDGFAANARAPFAAGGNRIQPFAKADRDRFIDIDSLRGIDTMELMPEFLDTIPGQELPYQYLSSYEGRGYRQWGLDQTPGTADDELLQAGVGLMDYYLQVVRNPPTSPNGQGWNKDTCQIISPGFDFEFGVGGFYNNENISIQPPSGSQARAAERDNITNFKYGKLN